MSSPNWRGGLRRAMARGRSACSIRRSGSSSLPRCRTAAGTRGTRAWPRWGAVFGRVWSRSISGTRILGCGESVVQVTTQTWTALATGRSATVDVVELFSFRDGLVSEVRVFQQDTHLLLATLDPT